MRFFMLFFFMLICHAVSLWSVPDGNGRLLWSHPAMSVRIGSIIVSPDGKHIAAAHPLAVWNVETGLPLQVREWGYFAAYADTSATVMAYMPNGDFICPAYSNTVWAFVLYSGETGQLIRDIAALPDSKRIQSLTCTPDGKSLVAGCADGAILVVDIQSGSSIAKDSIHPVGIVDIACSVGGSALYTLDREGNLVHTMLKDGELFADTSMTVATRGGLVSSAFSPAAGLLAVGTKAGGIVVYSLADGQQALAISLPDAVPDVAFSPDGSLLAIAVANEGVQVWDIKSSSLLATLATADYPASLAILPDNQTLVVGSYSSLEVWNIKQNQLVKTIAGAPVHAAFSADGTMMAVRSRTRVDIVATETGRRLGTIPTPVLPASDAVFSPDGQTLAVQLRDSIAFFAIPDCTPVGVFEDTATGWSWRGEQMLYSPDGQLLLHRTSYALRAFNAATHGELFTIPLGNQGHMLGVMTPDSRKLALTLWGGLEVYDLEAPVLHWNTTSQISRYLAVSGDGRLLAVCGREFRPGDSIPPPQTIRIMDVETGAILHSFALNDYYVYQGVPIAFSADDHFIISAERDSIRIREIATGQQVRAFRPALYSELNSDGNTPMYFSPKAIYLTAVDRDAGMCVWEMGEMPVAGVSALADDNAAARIYPMPAHNELVVALSVSQPGQVSVTISDVFGRPIAIVTDEWLGEGVHSRRWNTAAVPNGVYYCRVQTATESSIHKIIVVH